MQLVSRRFSGLAFGAGLAVSVIALGAARADDPPTMAQAQALIRGERYEEAASAYRAITDADAGNAQAWFMLGYALHAAGRYEEATPAHEKAASMATGQTRALALYNLGCAWSLRGDADKAFGALERAVDAGMLQKGQLAGDADLASLRADARWEALIERIDAARDLPNALSFWVGAWDVYAPAGGRAGSNVLERRVDGKVIHESWKPEGSGSSGESWNWYDPSERAWHQVWVDASGLSTHFLGRAHAEGGIMFEGTQVMPDGTTALVRMHVREIGQGRVRQTGTQSEDAGATWAPRYDLIYVPAGRPFEPVEAG